jgi:hypothetical protein
MAIPIKAALRTSSIIWQWKHRNRNQTRKVQRLLLQIRNVAEAVDHKSFIASMDRVIAQFDELVRTSGEP